MTVEKAPRVAPSKESTPRPSEFLSFVVFYYFLNCTFILTDAGLDLGCWFFGWGFWGGSFFFVCCLLVWGFWSVLER